MDNLLNRQRGGGSPLIETLPPLSFIYGFRLEAIKCNSEDFPLIENLFYLHAPKGVSRSKLAAGAKKLLGVAATAR